MLISYCCCNKLSQTYQLKTRQMHSLRLVGVGSLKSVLSCRNQGVIRAGSFWRLSEENLCIAFFFIYFFFIFFLGPHPQQVEVPRLGTDLELQLQAYTAATATQDLSHICDLYHSSQQRRILNPLSEARDRTHILMDPTQGR